MDNDHSLDELIAEEVLYNTIYQKSYQGRVLLNIDPIKPKSGRVLVLCDELGWDTPDLGAWCYPRQIHGITLPKIGAYVEISFLRGDRDWPVYRCLAQEVQENVPSNYDGLPTTHVPFESPLRQGMVVDDLKQSVTLLSNLLVQLGSKTASSPYVKGEVLFPFLTALVTSLNAFITLYQTHMHPTAALGPPSPPLPPNNIVPPLTAPPVSMLSTKVFGK